MTMSDERDAEARLREEIERWRGKLEEELPVTGDEEFVTNIEAYHEDSRYFEDEGYLVESFEALVWAWSWVEIGRRIGRIED